MRAYPCPCCGYLVFPGPPGSEEQCPICGWIDDESQLRFAGFSGRPNGTSLLEGQRSFVEIGAKDRASLPFVRFPASYDRRDPSWRELDDDRDDIEPIPSDTFGLVYPDDLTTLYYWSPQYWRNSK
ncbi:MAG: hydrolase [Candidatus Eremiobacteraeota bacterium]|nr:hydrolase [Candidatus Eremiobacteraeota bacterium]